jgi:hypothetical protein
VTPRAPPPEPGAAPGFATVPGDDGLRLEVAIGPAPAEAPDLAIEGPSWRVLRARIVQPGGGTLATVALKFPSEGTPDEPACVSSGLQLSGDLVGVLGVIVGGGVLVVRESGWGRPP